jgi:hypothetical protein
MERTVKRKAFQAAERNPATYVHFSAKYDTLELRSKKSLLDLLQELCYLPKIDNSFQRQKNQHIRKKAKWNKEQLSGSTPLRDLVLSHAKTGKMSSCISPRFSLTDTAACKTVRRLNSL